MHEFPVDEAGLPAAVVTLNSLDLQEHAIDPE